MKVGEQAVNKAIYPHLFPTLFPRFGPAVNASPRISLECI